MPITKSKRPTLREVAEHAGVSTATVSLVVNQKAVEAGITETTQQIVHAAIERLQYTPNRMASAVVTGRSRMVGVVSALSRELFETQFGTRVLNGFVRGVRERGYHFVFLEDILSPETEGPYQALKAAREMCLEGLVLLIDIGRRDQVLDVRRWVSSSLPVVTVQFTFDPEGAPGFRVDHRRAVQECVDHLVGLGHTRIGFGSRHLEISRSKSTIALIDESLAGHKKKFDTNLVFEIPRWEKIGKFVDHVRRHRPTGLITLYDSEAVRAMGALREAGIHVPGDLSIIGYGDSPLAEDVLPAMTTFRPPMEEIGQGAINYLIHCIETHTEPDRASVHDTKGQLIIRQSTGPAPK
jgi:LacI family transcriptional regulator